MLYESNELSNPQLQPPTIEENVHFDACCVYDKIRRAHLAGETDNNTFIAAREVWYIAGEVYDKYISSKAG